jgi:hypothetical protein
MAEPAFKLANEFADIVKRPAEKLTTSGALKVGSQKALDKAGKVLPKAGKVLPIASLLLNSTPSVAEPKPTDIVKPQKLDFNTPQTEDTPMWKQKVSEMKPAKSDLPSWDDIVNSQGAKAQVSSPAVPGAEAQSTENNQPTEDNSKAKEEQKTRNENFQPELPKEQKSPIETPAEKTEKATPNRLSYNNLYSYYKSGGFGDPTSSDAKRDFGFAILDTIGSGLANAGRGIKGQSSEASKWENILKQGKTNQTEFEMLDKQLEQNEKLQSYVNDLRKNFEAWALKYKIDLGSDDKKMEALKKFTAAYGNQMENDWLRMLGQAGINVGTSLGSAYLMNRIIR